MIKIDIEGNLEGKEKRGLLSFKKQRAAFWEGRGFLSERSPRCRDCTFRSTEAFSTRAVAVLRALIPITRRALIEHLLWAKNWARWYMRIHFQPD